uniref:hypothetical protein n=1 Tax=Providencia heimbachae TaxID=333962 RepID=UPI00223FBCE7
IYFPALFVLQKKKKKRQINIIRLVLLIEGNLGKKSNGKIPAMTEIAASVQVSKAKLVIFFLFI